MIPKSGWTPLPADRPALILHGGAWAIPFDETEAHIEGLRRAARLGAGLLRAGYPAVDVVCEVVACLEDHPAFDAGLGSVLNRDGEVEMDAGVMCGRRMAFGAVAAVQRIQNPVRVARRLVEEEGSVRLLVARGAERYAVEHGFGEIDSRALVVERERERFERLRRAAAYHTSHPFLDHPVDRPGDTVGCVARDRDGRLAAATSTGGTPFTRPGRVGDSPLPGSGFYATPHAAVSATGWGEAIATVVLSARTAERVERGEPADRAAAAELARMHALVANPDGEGAAGGLIVVDARGRCGWAYTTPRMARAGWREGEAVWTAL